MQKIAILFIGALVIATGIWYFIFSNKSAIFDFNNEEFAYTGDAVAIVNGEAISRADFEALQSQIAAQQSFKIESLDIETKKQLQTQVIETLVSQTLLRQAVRKSGLTALQKDVDAQIETIKTQLGGEKAFQEALAAERLSQEELRKQISEELTTQMYLNQEIDLALVSATDEEIEAAYNQAAAAGENIPALEDVRDQVESQIIQQKQQTLFVQFIQELREKADIEILL